MEEAIKEGNITTWFTDGVMGRRGVDAQATIVEAGPDGKPINLVWMEDAALHRTSGAAVVQLEGGMVVGVEFWVKGVQLDTEAVLMWLVGKGYKLDEALGLSRHGWDDRIRLQFVIQFKQVGKGVLVSR